MRPRLSNSRHRHRQNSAVASCTAETLGIPIRLRHTRVVLVSTSCNAAPWSTSSGPCRQNRRQRTGAATFWPCRNVASDSQPWGIGRRDSTPRGARSQRREGLGATSSPCSRRRQWTTSPATSSMEAAIDKLSCPAQARSGREPTCPYRMLYLGICPPWTRLRSGTRANHFCRRQQSHRLCEPGNVIELLEREHIKLSVP